jgi:hypothetical protein
MLILYADLALNDNELTTAGAATLNETDEKRNGTMVTMLLMSATSNLVDNQRLARRGMQAFPGVGHRSL